MLKDDAHSKAKASRSFPILSHDHNAPSVFTVESLLREASRQKSIPRKNVPKICLLDPDADILASLLKEKNASRHTGWACYHTKLYCFVREGIEIGIIGGAVGAPFAVLVAEELFACGCRLIISISSAGQVSPTRKPPYFVCIERAVRDEGTSYHYMPPSDCSLMDPSLSVLLKNCFLNSNVSLEFGTSWTTDAPFRETAALIRDHASRGVLCAEMEAAALYALARAKKKKIVCFALVTNQMGTVDEDFEKGAAGGSIDALKIVSIVAKGWLNKRKKTEKSGSCPQNFQAQ